MSNSNNKYKTDTTFKNLLENKNQSTQSSIFSEVSVNSSRFEEAKNNRKLRESQVLNNIAKTWDQMERNKELFCECLKFRPIKKEASKQN